MSGGPILPVSEYLGGAAGLIASSVYVPATNTNTAGAIEGYQVAASLSADAPLVLQFAIPEVVPTGTCKLRGRHWANATSGVVKYTVSDGVTSAGSNIGVATLTAETQVSLTWTTAGSAPTKSSITPIPTTPCAIR